MSYLADLSRRINPNTDIKKPLSDVAYLSVLTLDAKGWVR